MPEPQSKSNELLIFFSSLRPSLLLFKRNYPLRLAGATAFFTTFALPPIIFLLVQLFGLFIGQRNMGRGLLESVAHVLGKDGADQVRQVIKSIRGFNNNWYIITIGFLFLFFVATTLFNVIKDSLNQIWQISVKEKPGLLFMLSIRLRSFAVILFVGVLFLANVFFQGLEIIAGDYINTIWQDSGNFFKSFLREVVGIIIVSAWFIVLFRFLADGRPSWKASLLGGLLTGISFEAGRVLLTVLLINSNIGQLYGPSGSFVLILLFVFYSSFILYFGASFIAVYSQKKEWPIKPNHKAYATENGSGIKSI